MNWLTRVGQGGNSQSCRCVHLVLIARLTCVNRTERKLWTAGVGRGWCYDATTHQTICNRYLLTNILSRYL